MLNGNVLKIAFLMIVGTLCLILMLLTIGASFKFISLPEYEQLMGIIGVVGVFSGIVQAFIHSNIDKPEQSKVEAKP